MVSWKHNDGQCYIDAAVVKQARAIILSVEQSFIIIHSDLNQSFGL